MMNVSYSPLFNESLDSLSLPSGLYCDSEVLTLSPCPDVVKGLLRVGIGVGGTFTDLVAVDEETGRVVIEKSPSTPREPMVGMLNVLKKARLKRSQITSIFHGTTVATNALLERKLPEQVGYITTKGFRDIPFIQKTHRKHHYDLKWIKPEPLVKRQNCVEVTERIDYKGRVLVSLDKQEAARTVAEFKRKGIASIAVCFLFSYINPIHEIEMAKIIERVYPEARVSLSYDLDPQWREYDRASTTIANAYLQPLIGRHAVELARGLAQEGVKAPLLIMKSNGGVMSHEAAAKKPISMLVSGPVGGVLAGVYYCNLLEIANMITIDMGGTSFDVSLVSNKGATLVSQFEVEWNVPVRFPMLDISAIGAGGGSMAWIDKGGLLNVGPQSAGADPGPVCYGKGGKVLTVTDANLFLGRLNPDYFLGGEMKLNIDLSRKAMKALSGRLSMDEYETANAIIRIVDHNMVNAMRLVSINRGYDPRDFALLSFGGAGSLHATSLARTLGIRKVIVPTYVPAFSTFGLLTADMRVDYVQTVRMRSDMMNIDEVNDLLKRLQTRVLDDIRTEGYKGEPTVIQEIEMRYLGQNYGLDISVPAEQVSQSDLQNVYDRFHSAHKMKYGYSLDEIIEFVNFKSAAVGRIKPPGMPKMKVETRRPVPKTTREVWFEGAISKCPIYERETLPVGSSLEGPAIVEERMSTTLIHEGDSLAIDEYGNEIIQIGQ